jgi:hypothetical protein
MAKTEWCGTCGDTGIWVNEFGKEEQCPDCRRTQEELEEEEEEEDQ